MKIRKCILSRLRLGTGFILKKSLGRRKPNFEDRFVSAAPKNQSNPGA
jgi:hypothetical protein